LQAVHAGKFTALAKMVIDQAIQAPVGIALFFVSLGLMEGQGFKGAWEDMRAKLKPTLLANWGLWPAANYVNFAFVPSEQRILYVNVVYVSAL
jgi:protein Mpv17